MSSLKPLTGQSELDQRAYGVRLDSAKREEQLQALRAAAPWYRAFLAPYLPKDRAARLLDVPCGAGNLLFALHGMGYSNLRGVDGDASQVEFARGLGLPVEVEDAFVALQSEAEGSVERIFSLDFVEHVEKAQAIEFCRLARSRLSPSGLLILRTPCADGPFGASDRSNDITHKWGMTSGAAVQLLRLAGFEPSACRVLQEAPVPYKWQNRVRLVAFHATTRALGAWLRFCGLGSPAVWTRSMWVVAEAR